MKQWIAFWNIVLKDMRAYYLKPPNISWGLIFPIAWTGMFFIKSGGGLEQVLPLLPGVIAVSILFGTTSMLAVTVTFEKKSRSFERLLLAPIPLELLMLAKTGGAILFGVANAFVPVALAMFLVDFSGIAWNALVAAVAMIAIVSTFLGLFIAVSVSEIFEAQTFSNFFRFPMIFLCGLFFPIDMLPVFLQPLSHIIPLTYGVDILHGRSMRPTRCRSPSTSSSSEYFVQRYFLSASETSTGNGLCDMPGSIESYSVCVCDVASSGVAVRGKEIASKGAASPKGLPGEA